MTNTQDEIDRIHRDLATCREAMNNPRVGLFAMKRLYAQLGALLREQARLEAEQAEHAPR